MAIDDANPYAAPQSRPEAQPRHDVGDTGSVSIDDYVSNSGRAQAITVLMGLTLLLSLIGAASDVLQVGLLQRIEASMPVTPQEIENNDARVGLIAIGTLLLLIHTIVAVCMWGVRAYRNLQPLGALDLRTTPGWAAGSFFVPFLNLYRPYQIYAEAWKASDPDEPASDHDHRAPLAAVVVGWWWAFWLLSNIVNNISARLSGVQDPTVEALIFGTWASFAGFLLTAVAAGLAILMIREINSRQEEKYRRLLTGEAGGGPAPMLNDWPFEEPRDDFR